MPLVLGRYEGESIMVGDDIKVTVKRISRNQVRLEFDAPKDVKIWREELYERLQKQEVEG